MKTTEADLLAALRRAVSVLISSRSALRLMEAALTRGEKMGHRSVQALHDFVWGLAEAQLDPPKPQLIDQDVLRALLALEAKFAPGVPAFPETLQGPITKAGETELLANLHRVVAAIIANWLASADLERALADGEEMSPRASDTLRSFVYALADAQPDPPQLELIDENSLNKLLALTWLKETMDEYRKLQGPYVDDFAAS